MKLLLHAFAAVAVLLLLHGDCSAVAHANAIQVALSRLPRTRDASLLLAATERATREQNASAMIGSTAGDVGEPTTHAAAHIDAIETRIYSGEGSHTMRVIVGGQTRELIIDTGSGKTAFICEGCRKCGVAHVNTPFQFTPRTEYLACDLSDAPVSASTVSTLSSTLLSLATWTKAPSYASTSTCSKCVDTKCAYSQTYVEGDYWLAFKVRDEMQLASSFKADVDFGCIFEQNGVFTVQSSDGIVGFSQHSDALHEQFYRRGVTTTRIFSQCLGAQGGMLTLGGVDLSINYTPVQYTPIRDTGYQYWTVTLISVSIGDVVVDLNSAVYNKDRGCVLDSGTTFVYLPAAARAPFEAAWRHAVGNDRWPISGSSYFLSALEVAQLPRICFSFLNNAALCMAPAMYLFRSAPRQYAGTIFFSDSAKSTIIGASALTGHNVIYDVDNGRIGIAEANCEATVSSDSAAAMVELSLSPGGDTFRLDTRLWRSASSTAAVQMLLGALTVAAVAMLVNVVWTEVVATRTERKQAKASAGDVPKDELLASATALLAVHDDHDDAPSAFAFILMRDDDDDDSVAC